MRKGDKGMKVFGVILILAINVAVFGGAVSAEDLSVDLTKSFADVTLTLYVHEGSASGPLLSGARVTGQDGAGNSFDKTTGTSGYVTIIGTPGTWQFTASNAGYQTSTWTQSTTATCMRHAFLEKDDVTLTLYVHEGSASGPVLSGARVTGQDGAGNGFDKTTGTSGYVTIIGTPGTWQFTASNAGYQTSTWTQSTTATCMRHAFLEKDDVTLTLYVHEGSASGPVLSGARVTGQDGAGNGFDKTTGSSGYVTIIGTPGTWQFTASNAGYHTNSWTQSTTATCMRHAFLAKDDVTLTLYVHEGSASGPVLSGARVTGQDGAGNSFDKTTGTSGYVTIIGTPGTWQFTASNAGYQTSTWTQSTTATCTRHAFLAKDDVTLTLYVHEGSASGPVLSGARVTGQDGAGNGFDKTTGSSGYVTITGTPGTWQFTASKTGYQTSTWTQSTTTTCTRHAFLAKDDVTLTLYVHEGSASGPVLSGVRVTGQDGAGNSFDKTTGSSGYVTITGTPGSWQFSASKTGYQTNSWTQSITTTCERHAFLIKEDVTLTMYVHEGSASGPVLSGVRVTGQDGAGNSFDKTTGSSGSVTITGTPGTWQFTASKTGYQTNSWTQSITTTCERHAFLIKEDVTLTLYVHEGSASGPVLSGVRVTGQDGAGNSFDKTTGSSGSVTITGTPGSWQFSASKTGYQTNSWTQSTTTTCERHAFLIKEDVTLTMYVHEGSASGPVLSGVRVTGQDGAGNGFDKTTGSSGSVTITGTPGSWQFSASKTGYQTNSWTQSITTTCTKHAFLIKEDVTLTLYVHEGSASGPVLSGVRVTGQDGAGNGFDKTTGSGGYVTITGTPGSWQFSASKTGYQTNSWTQSITTTCTKHAFLEITGIGYSRQSAYNYAQKYAYKVCSDGYFFEASYPPSYLGAETPVPSECGFDCTHFVSCCIGAETHEQGGGLDVPSRTEAYGEPGADKLRKWLIDSGNAMYETTIGELEKGDVISYDWEGDGYFDHVVLYLDSGKIAAHSVSYWNVNWDVYKQNHPNFNYKLIHIKGGEQPLTCAIELQKNGIPMDKVNVGQFFDIYVGDSSGSIAQVRFLSDENQNGIVDDGFTWTEWYNWDISSEDWDAETKIMRWSFHTEGRKEVWAEVKDDVDQTTKCSANIITGNLYWLAKAIMSEASIGRQEERIAVGWTVLNRFDSGNFGSSIKDVVKNGYAYNQEPTQEIIVLAKDLLERKIPDPTGGAIYFFSPISMPKEEEENKCKPPIGNGNMDCNGGLYQVPGTSEKVYFPIWAKPKEGWTVTDFYPTVEDLEWISGLENVRNWYFMFYRPISSLPLSAHIKVGKTGVCSGDEFTFNGSASIGQIASYKWNFDDGTIVEGSGKPDKVSHRFRGAMGNSKDYTIKLTVEDEKGATASDTVSITVYPLKRNISVYSSLAPYLPPSVAMTPIMEITVYYNWVDEIEGQDEYIVSEVHLDSELSLSFALYMFSIQDDWSKIWSKIHKGVGKEDVSFTYPFNVPRDCTKTFGNEHFKGLTVGSNSNLNFVVDGRELGLNLRPTFFRVSRTIELGPGKQTEMPSIYPEGNMAGITSALSSPAELCIYDSQGNVTGLVDGKIKEEIPNSIYDEESEIIVIFSPEDINFYSYKVAGTEEGVYGLEISAVEDGEANMFAVTNFSTTNKTTHQYDINWSTHEATVQIDSDGDGEFEQNITLQPPVASFSYTPENPTVNQAITFNASSSYDSDGNITNYEWNFGDGTNGSGRITTHSYSSAGEYPVTLIITDNSSTLNATTKIITIPDITPPKSITNLTNTTGQTWINWTWTNPPDADFNYTMVYLNGTWKINTSDPYYNTTGINSNTFYEIGTHTVDKVGNVNATWVNQMTKTLPNVSKVFDTDPGTYPSIFGTHNGTIKPSQTIMVSKMYTYPCAGTGGHTEYVRIWGNGINVNASWNGYVGDWHNISFGESFTLVKGETYNYTIRTGSYPQIIHKQNHTTLDGSLITCEEFIDTHGKGYDDWIPAFKLFL